MSRICSPLLTVLALSAGLALGSSPALAETIDGARIHVIDGDTVALPSGERIRLAGIDAPETWHPRCQAELEQGRAATARLRELLAGPVEIERQGTDRYGRTLARLVTAAGGDVEQPMVADGLAVAYLPGRAAWAARRDHWCGGAR